MEKKRVSVGVAPDDLHVGDFVAVIEPKKARTPKFVMGRDPDGDPIVLLNAEHQNQSSGAGCPGVPHQVLGLSWPWVVFGVLLPGGEVDGPIIHDLRKVKCMRLDDSFVDAIKEFVKPETESKEPEVPF